MGPGHSNGHQTLAPGNDGVGRAMDGVGDWRGSALRKIDIFSVFRLRAVRRIVAARESAFGVLATGSSFRDGGSYVP